MQRHVKPDESTDDRLGLVSLAGRMSRSLGAVLADLHPVDSGSLEVLLYCPDELAASTPRDVEVEPPR